MSETRAVPIVVIAAVAAAAAFVVGVGPQATDASWVRAKTFALTATAVLPAPPTALACTASGIGGDVTFTWTAPAGTPPSSYTLKWSGGSSGPWPTSTGTVPLPPLLGSRVVSVFSDYGSWQSVAGTPTRTINNLIGLWNCG
jgi:hypothetical protein